MEEIVVETLKSLENYIPKLITGCQDTVENLQSGNEASALQVMPDIVEGLQWIISAISGLQANKIHLNVEINSLTEHFQEIASALEMEDYVLLADLLDYEIVPVLRDWEKNINLVVV